jgi:hypothetical protein
MEPDSPAVMQPTETRGTADAPMPASPFHHCDYDGRGLSIGPLDHLDRLADSERFAIR